jgi:hypothetical protein
MLLISSIRAAWAKTCNVSAMSCMKSLRYWKESKKRKTTQLKLPPSCNPSLLMMNYPVGLHENIGKDK